MAYWSRKFGVVVLAGVLTQAVDLPSAAAREKRTASPSTPVAAAQPAPAAPQPGVMIVTIKNPHKSVFTNTKLTYK